MGGGELRYSSFFLYYHSRKLFDII